MRSRRRWLHALLGTIAVVCLVAVFPLKAREVVVTRTDGRRLRGELVAESADDVTLRIAGKTTTIARAEIRNVEPVLILEQTYAERRAKLKDNDVDGRYELAYWLFDQEAFELAMRELRDLKEKYPDNKRVASLIPIVEDRLKQQRSRSTAKGPVLPRTGNGLDPKEGDDAADDDRKRLERLNEEQINVIRVFELDLRTRPSVIVPRPVLNELIDKYPDFEQLRGESNQRSFRRAKGYIKLRTMFDLAQEHPEVRALYKEVKVRDDPPALQTFRNRIHRRYVLNYCAKNGCHGDREDTDPFLFRDKPTLDATVYTNFFLLDSYKPIGRYDMIDREEPRASLLIQYAKSRKEALSAHPDVPGWTPRLRPRRDPMEQALVDWIQQLQRHRLPNYMIDYRFPDPTKYGNKPDRGDTPDEADVLGSGTADANTPPTPVK